MKTIIAALLVATCLFTVPVIAGGKHSHDADGGHNLAPMTQDEVISKASDKVKKLAANGKVDATWSGVKATSAEQKKYGKDPEWLITFNNNKVDDQSKQTLYLFYTLDGHYIAANYTGN